MNSQCGWEVYIAAIRSLPSLLTVCMWNQSCYFQFDARMTKVPEQPMGEENDFEKAWQIKHINQLATTKDSPGATHQPDEERSVSGL